MSLKADLDYHCGWG